MEFDFAILNRRIVEKFHDRRNFAAALGLPVEKLNKILDDQIHFTFSEIIKASELLDIPGDEIVNYFFTPKVR
jgi:plasmid maintenance system antidote protein VapI